MSRLMTKTSAAVFLSLALLASPANAQEKAPPAVKPKAAKKKAAKLTLVESITKKTWASIVKVYGAGGIKGIPGFSTGVVVDSRGLIVTAWSVALRTDFLKIVDDQGRAYSVVLHRHDPKLGVALLRTKEAAKLTPMKLGDSSKVRIGHSILSYGNAFNVAVGVEKPSLAEGVISLIAPLDARVGVQRSRVTGTVFLSDAPNNPGTQGGPMLNLEGELMGINGAVVESASTNTPLNFHIATNSIRKFVEEGINNWNLPEKEKKPPEAVAKKKKLWLGLRILRFFFNRSPPTYIDEVFPDSPASKAGLEPDDLIFQINGHTIRSTEAYDAQLGLLEIGKEVVFTVKRGDKVIRCKMTPVEFVAPKKPKVEKIPNVKKAPEASKKDEK
jgi:S1-C subfamily serine protease